MNSTCKLIVSLFCRTPILFPISFLSLSPLPSPSSYLLFIHDKPPSTSHTHPPHYRVTGPILEFLDEWGTENLDMVDIREIANPKTTKVFVNGNWVGVHRDPEDLISEFTDLIRLPSFCISSSFEDLRVIN